jgi:hypothetical protein
MPLSISFDHDLGDNVPTGKDLANWLVEQDMQGIIKFPTNFEFHVHSANPVGRQNIEGLLNCYFNFKETDDEQ